MASDLMTGFDPDNDEDLKQANAAFAAAGDQHTEQQATDAFAKAAPPKQEQQGGLQHWFQNLPQNVGSGLMTAAINTADAMHSGLKWIDDKALEGHEALTGENANQIKRTEQGESIDTPEYGTVRNAVQNFKSNYIDVKNPTMSDNITQGVAQFAIPFMGWSKAVSAVGGIGKIAAAGRTLLAESATAGTAMAPGDGRFADMVELGKHTEGKFADALNAISPDGSLVNNYLNYMTADRDSESEFEARAKNIVDTVTGGAVVSPLIHAGMTMLKGGMAGLKYSLENGVGSIDQLAVPNQAGRIGYHGSPHDFNTDTGFDNSKIGSGEGAQVYGYGHYLAESPDVAGQYQKSLSAKFASPALTIAKNALSAAGGDSVKAYKALATKLPGDGIGDIARARELIRSGNAARGNGSFITADVDDAHVNNMLDWDKPLSEQKLPVPVQGLLDDLKAKSTAAYGDSILNDPKANGADAHMVLAHHFGSDQAAAAYLDSQGVPGIKYLDGNSRGTGEGTRNLVVFDGKKIKVTSKNGTPVTK